MFIALAAMFEVKVLGHSFVRRLALYSVEHKSLHFNLDEDKFHVTFVARGGLKVPQLYSFATDVVGSDVVFRDVGTNDISDVDPTILGDRVLAYATYLGVMAGVQRVVVSQMFFRSAEQSRFFLREDFNDRVVVYNNYMADAVQSFEKVTFWRHRGLWADWSKYLVDGVHFNQEGNRKYYNSVRGAIIAAANTI